MNLFVSQVQKVYTVAQQEKQYMLQEKNRMKEAFMNDKDIPMGLLMTTTTRYKIQVLVCDILAQMLAKTVPDVIRLQKTIKVHLYQLKKMQYVAVDTKYYYQMLHFIYQHIYWLRSLK